MSSAGLRAATDKMRADGQPAEAVRTFERAYAALEAGASGTLPDREIEPVRDVLGAGDLPRHDPSAALDRVAIVKLNGGLGTSMGMTRAKSLVEARDGLSFLDVIARQTLALRARHGVRLPLVLMNSYRTRDDSLAALARYPDLPADVPPDFLQHLEPRIRADDLAPVDWPDAPELNGAPPATATCTGAAQLGMLAALLDRGYRYAFASNADNLGAVLDPALLAWFAAEESRSRWRSSRARRPTARAATSRAGAPTAASSARDRPGRRPRLLPRRRPLAPLQLEQPLDRPARARRAARRRRRDDRPPADRQPQAHPRRRPGHPARGRVGAAIGAFDGARAVQVPRTRFAPVKTTDDLLVLRCDVYRLTGDARVERAPERTGDEPFVALDPAHFATLAAFDARFPHGPPSLVACDRLVVRGDVTFGACIVARGAVEITAPEEEAVHIPDGAVLGPTG